MPEGMELAVRGDAEARADNLECGALARHAEDVVRQGREGAASWDGHRLATHFQPIFSVRRGACSGYEALLRVHDLQKDVAVPPTRLFERAEAALRVRLDWICRALHLRNFATVDRGDRTLFLNVFPEAALHDARCVAEFADLVRYYGLSPRRVCVEILETDCTDEGLLREAVAAYRDMGVTIAMDDFGVGRSNFDRIASIRPDIVKIDRSVLVDAVGDQKAREALPGIVKLLHDAGSKVAAEGVESAAEALLAVTSGADFLQGFYFARPRANLADETFSERILHELLRVREARTARARVVG
jgi:EAL domain-containing protein (putative c-di-GMP-specific phosphodiesterase class I)